MPRSMLASLLLVAACAPGAPPRDDRTPEAAVRSFFEAGRSGDHDAAAACLCANERRQGQRLDCRDLGGYSLSTARYLDDRRAVVTLRCGDVRTPLVAVREGEGWRVSLRRSLQQMRAPEPDPLASAPR